MFGLALSIARAAARQQQQQMIYSESNGLWDQSNGCTKKGLRCVV